jgi:hypothetical protein
LEPGHDSWLSTSDVGDDQTILDERDDPPTVCLDGVRFIDTEHLVVGSREARGNRTISSPGIIDGCRTLEENVSTTTPESEVIVQAIRAHEIDGMRDDIVEELFACVELNQGGAVACWPLLAGTSDSGTARRRRRGLPIDGGTSDQDH